MIGPAVLFMSCVLSLSLTFTSTLGLQTENEPQWPDAHSFISQYNKKKYVLLSLFRFIMWG